MKKINKQQILVLTVFFKILQYVKRSMTFKRKSNRIKKKQLINEYPEKCHEILIDLYIFLM